MDETFPWSRGQFTEAIQIAKRNGCVRFADVAEQLSYASFLFNQAKGYNQGSSGKRAKFDGMTMKDFVRWLWNSPGNASSAYRGYGKVLKPAGKDENGDYVYEYAGV